MRARAGHAGRPSRGPNAKRRISGSLVLVLAVTLALGTFATVWVADVLWPRWPGKTASLDAPSLPIDVGGVVFNVPPAAIRVALQRRPGTQERLDIAVEWPSLGPPDPAHKPHPAEPSNPRFDRLFVTVAAAASTMPPIERIKAIYPRYLAEGRFRGPTGLLVARFNDGTPYQGEDLFYDETDPERFVVRCTRPQGQAPGSCLNERRLGGADVTVRFPRNALPDWQEIQKGIDRLVAAWRPVVN